MNSDFPMNFVLLPGVTWEDSLTTRILSHLQAQRRDSTGEEHPFWYFSIQNVNKAHATCCYPGAKWFGELGQGIHSHGRHLAFHRTFQETAFQWLQGFYFMCKTSNYIPSKEAFFCKDILKYLNLSGRSLLMDPCHSEDSQKSAPAWSSWHINVRFDDIVYFYFKTLNIYIW